MSGASVVETRRRLAETLLRHWRRVRNVHVLSWEVEAGGTRARGQVQLHRSLEASLVYTAPVPKSKTKTTERHAPH